MEFNKENMPKHVAIIMDGNRRWAKAQGKPAGFGHKAGAKTLENIVRYANKIGLEHITVYAFSTENWKRAEEEVNALMMLLQNYLDEYSKRADSENIKVKILGDVTVLSQGMQKSIINCMERTKNNTGITFNIALNYGGKLFYIYGASSNEKRNLMPNYLMQQTMIRWALETGCTEYDFGGVFEMDKSNGLYRFKEGFCHQEGVTRFVGEIDYVYKKSIYFAFVNLLPIYKKLRGLLKKITKKEK